MKSEDETQIDLDEIDTRILALLQEHCKMPLAKIGQRVGLSAPAVIERIKKLEESGVITGYTALLDTRKLGCDITAFIGVLTSHPSGIRGVEQQIESRPEVLECHHVTGGYTLLLKVKTANTTTLEEIISHLRSIEGVSRTETMVVLSTSTERQLLLRPDAPPLPRPRRRGVAKLMLQAESAS
jgi:Lrp/AsnC family transcriptional regulator, leucine-responsive regulatory protein